MEFRCQSQNLRVANNNSPFTSELDIDEILSLPISHGDGNYFVDEQTLAQMESNGQIAFQYCNSDGEITYESNPNGSVSNIAGVTNESGNVLGLMPHPERVVEQILGGTDGLKLLASINNFLSRPEN